MSVVYQNEATMLGNISMMVSKQNSVTWVSTRLILRSHSFSFVSRKGIIFLQYGGNVCWLLFHALFDHKRGFVNFLTAPPPPPPGAMWDSFIKWKLPNFFYFYDGLGALFGGLSEYEADFLGHSHFRLWVGRGSFLCNTVDTFVGYFFMLYSTVKPIVTDFSTAPSPALPTSS